MNMHAQAECCQAAAVFGFRPLADQGFDACDEAVEKRVINLLVEDDAVVVVMAQGNTPGIHSRSIHGCTDCAPNGHPPQW